MEHKSKDKGLVYTFLKFAFPTIARYMDIKAASGASSEKRLKSVADEARCISTGVKARIEAPREKTGESNRGPDGHDKRRRSDSNIYDFSRK